MTFIHDFLFLLFMPGRNENWLISDSFFILYILFPDRRMNKHDGQMEIFFSFWDRAHVAPVGFKLLCSQGWPSCLHILSLLGLKACITTPCVCGTGNQTQDSLNSNKHFANRAIIPAQSRNIKSVQASYFKSREFEEQN